MHAKLQNARPTSLDPCIQVAEVEVETRWYKADGYSAAEMMSLEL